MKPLLFPTFLLLALLMTGSGLAQDEAEDIEATVNAPVEVEPPPPPPEPTPEAEAAPEPAPEAAPEAAASQDIRQVQVQVWISEMNEIGLRQLGANLNYSRFVRGVEQSGSLQQISTNVIDTQGEFSRVTLPAPTSLPPNPPFSPPLRPDENPGTAGIQSRQGAGLEFSVINPGYGTVDGVFRSIETKADVDLISKPELLVMNSATATIKAGGQVPYQSVQYDAKGVPNLGIAWRDIGVNMEITPTIMPNDTVQLMLTELEVSEIQRIENLRGVDLPVFSKRSQTGVVYVPNGQTLVIGGLSSRSERKLERRVPVVGRVPLLGMPFRKRRNEVNVTTLLVFVSPTIVDLRHLSEESSSALNFWRERGTDWVSTQRIDAEIEAMQDEL